MKNEITKSPIIPLIVTMVIIVLIGLFIKNPNFLPTSSSSSPIPIQKSISINQKDISVFVAKSDTERTKGLAGITSLDASSGMLFVFDNPTRPQTFWMKGVSFPIDIIWIKDNKIVKIDKNVPTPDPTTPDDNLPRYSAGVPVNYVLEVNAGYSDNNSIKVGDDVNFSGL